DWSEEHSPQQSAAKIRLQIAAADQGRNSACTEPTTELMKSANGSLVTPETAYEIRKTTAVRSRCRGLTSTGLLMEAARCLRAPKPRQQNLTERGAEAPSQRTAPRPLQTRVRQRQT